ncbi:MAG: hypothetical protein ACJA0H_001146 [Francisellaceae bacterium]|jgi:hypothetical protein
MINKYETGGYYQNSCLISLVQVEKETDKCVFINGRRKLKNSDWKIYHDTYQSAYNYLLHEATVRVDKKTEALDKANKHLDYIITLKSGE